MTHLASQLPDRVELGAIRTDEWYTEIIRTDGGTERRNARWTESLRSYEISIPPTLRTDADYLAVKALFAAAKGGLHSFDFNDWTDDVVIPVRFDTPMEIVGMTPEIDHIETFTLVEVKDPEAI